eukprot:SAG11_NODE_923_length_6539_cov_3.477484_4_plen_63_part_00
MLITKQLLLLLLALAVSLVPTQRSPPRPNPASNPGTAQGIVVHRQGGTMATTKFSELWIYVH